MKAVQFLTLISLLTSPLRAEDAKVPFERGVRADVLISRPSKVKGGDFDDFMQVIDPRIKLTNTDANQAYEGYQAFFMLIAESVLDRKILKIVSKDAFPIDLPPRGVLEKEGTEVTLRYDLDGAIFGEKYDGWLLVVGDPKGEVVMVKSTSPSLAKLTDKHKGLEAGKYYTKKLEEAKDPAMIGR